MFKKDKKKGMKKTIPVKTQPALPKLPDFPRLTDPESEEISKLPSFPSNSLGKKFSQDTIKGAITGEKEGGDFFDADDFEDEDEMRMMQEPLKKPFTEEVDSFRPIKGITEPVFIRIDKFEEALKIFTDAKIKLSSVERILEDIKRVKEKEEKELLAWEDEMKTLKSQIEKIDRDIFSKI